LVKSSAISQRPVMVSLSWLIAAVNRCENGSVVDAVRGAARTET
jgi:hypothetical protein